MSGHAPFIPILALALLSACSESGPTTREPTGPVFERSSGGDDRDSDDRYSDEARARPYAGVCATTVENLPSDDPSVQRLHIDGVCRIRPLGRTTLSAEQTVTLTFDDAANPFVPTGLAILTTVTYTTARGDQLYATFEGTGTLPDGSGIVCFSGTETFGSDTGPDGTGRFTRASGSARTEGCASVITNRGSFSTRGTIRY